MDLTTQEMLFDESANQHVLSLAYRVSTFNNNYRAKTKPAVKDNVNLAAVMP
jgi:hypothetical protein